MNLIPDKMGGSRKQVITLAVLAVVLVSVYLFEREPSSPAPVTPVTTVKTSPIARQPTVINEAVSGPKTMTRGGGSNAENFRPSIKPPEGVDITRIDPRLKTELLARLQKLGMEGGARSVFDFGAPPVPPPPLVAKIRPEDAAREQQREKERQEAISHPQPPPAPKAPPIPLKFYGYADRKTTAARQAFFLDGDDPLIKGENDVIRGRYKIVRIGINSATVEDLQFHDQQTLPLVEEAKT